MTALFFSYHLKYKICKFYCVDSGWPHTANRRPLETLISSINPTGICRIPSPKKPFSIKVGGPFFRPPFSRLNRLEIPLFCPHNHTSDPGLEFEKKTHGFWCVSRFYRNPVFSIARNDCLRKAFLKAKRQKNSDLGEKRKCTKWAFNLRACLIPELP